MTQRLGDQLAHALARVERGVRVLEDHLHLAPQRSQRAAVEARDVAPLEDDLRRRSARAGARCSARASTCRSPTRRRARASRPAAPRSETPSTACTCATSRRITPAALDREVLRDVARLEQRLARSRRRAPGGSSRRGARASRSRAGSSGRGARAPRARSSAGRSRAGAEAVRAAGRERAARRQREQRRRQARDRRQPARLRAGRCAGSSRAGPRCTDAARSRTARAWGRPRRPGRHTSRSTRSASSATTPMSCVMSDDGRAEVALQRAQERRGSAPGS